MGHTPTYVIIKKIIRAEDYGGGEASQTSTALQVDGADAEDDDPVRHFTLSMGTDSCMGQEALDRSHAKDRGTAAGNQAEVEYSIVLSHTYRVPVLYFTFRTGLASSVPSLDAVYAHLVPEAYKSTLANQAVLGAISLGVRPPAISQEAA